jgi:protein-S-isoprenylcysteine O-methyltransferase Ste14
MQRSSGNVESNWFEFSHGSEGVVKSLWVAARTLVYMTCFLGLWGWLALSTRRFDSAVGLSLPETLHPAGIVLMIAGGVLGLVCVGTFVTLGRGTPAPFDPPREFVARGIYKFVRNPMYIGGIFLLVGLGCVERSGSMILFALLLSILVHLGVVFLEEPDLEKRFGESFRQYKRAVNRWIPRRPSQSQPQ